MGFHADAVDDAIGSASAGTLVQCFQNVRLQAVIDDVGTTRGRKAQTAFDAVDGDHAIGAEQICRTYCELPDRSASPYRDDVAVFDAALFRGLISRRKDIAEKQHPLVLEIAFDTNRTDVGERNANVFRLAARVT